MSKDLIARQDKNSLSYVSGNLTKELITFAENNKLTFTEEETKVVINALRSIEPVLSSQGLDWNHFNKSSDLRNNLISTIQQTVFLKVNPSATPRECFFQIRNKKIENGKDVKYEKFLEFGIEGAGNDTILRKFGVGVKDVKSYIVYEGDEFTGVVFDGFEEKLPVFKPKMRKAGESKGKALYAVYLIMKKDGRVETAIAEREDVKQSLLAHIRQNGASEEYVSYLSNYSIDDILDFKVDKLTYKDKKQVWNAVYKKYVVTDVVIELSKLISPAWKSAVSREKMIERKMRNHAIRRYPKDFGNANINTFYEETFEDEKYENQLNNPKETATEFIEHNDADFENTANKNTIPGVEIKKESDIVDVEVDDSSDTTDIVVDEHIDSEELKAMVEFEKEVIDDEKIESDVENTVNNEEDLPDWLS